MPFSRVVPEPQRGWSEPSQSPRRGAFLSAPPPAPRARTPLQVNFAGPRARRERTEPRRALRARARAEGAGPLPGARSAHLPGSVARRRPTAAATAATAGAAAGPTTRAARGGARPDCGGTSLGWTRRLQAQLLKEQLLRRQRGAASQSLGRP